jgi:acyl carrier protein
MMQLEQIFSEALGIPLEQICDTLSYQGIPQWDSVAHMGLIAQLEDCYGVLLDTDDIIDMSSVAKAREILAKYGVAP